MSDRLHDHLTLGFRPGCVACAQLQADLALCRPRPAQIQAKQLFEV